jgi:hypothetical protein
LENSDHEDVIRISDCPTPEETEYSTIILCCCNKCNNLTDDRPFYYAISALERFIQVDAIQAFDHQNLTDIDEDTTILAIIM